MYSNVMKMNQHELKKMVITISLSSLTVYVVWGRRTGYFVISIYNAIQK